MFFETMPPIYESTSLITPLNVFTMNPWLLVGIVQKAWRVSTLVFDTAEIAKPFTKSSRKPIRKKKPMNMLKTMLTCFRAQTIIPQTPVSTAMMAPAKSIKNALF